MSFIGRIIAGARDLSFGGPLGALLDRTARHIPTWHAHGDGGSQDGDPRRRIAFTIAVIALGAKMARADGAVTRDEVAAFREVFQVPRGEEDHVRLVFDLARKSTAGFESYARQIGRLFASDHAVLEDLLGGLFHIALADGRLCPDEDAYLREVARHFGFSAGDYTRIRAHHAGVEEGAEDPHVILGVGRDASLSAIREAYHRLVRASHPDLVIAQGLPPECVALATARVARINAAYDRLAKRPGAVGMTLPGVRDRLSPNHAQRVEPAGIDMLVLHYTGMKTAREAIERLCDPEAQVSAHYVIEENGAIWRLVPEALQAFHAGRSCWAGSSNLNEVSVGIEIVNPGHEWGYRPFPEEQMVALERLSGALLSRFPIPPDRVVGHSDIAPDRKSDPGELFDWPRLARSGIGIWPEPATDLAHRRGRGVGVVERAGALADLAALGYCVTAGAETAVVTAFQRRFRPERWDGRLDAETALRLAQVRAAYDRARA